MKTGLWDNLVQSGCNVKQNMSSITNQLATAIKSITLRILNYMGKYTDFHSNSNKDSRLSPCITPHISALKL